MPVNGYPVTLVDTIGATVAANFTRPRRTGERGVGSERTAAGQRGVLNVIRTDVGGAAVVGNISVLGADLPNPIAGKPLGNAFASQATATSVRPQGGVLPTDGTTLAFTTDLDLASADLVALANSGGILVELPQIRLTGAALAAITGTMVAGVITTSAAFDSTLVPALGAGDTLLINGVGVTVVTATGSTITTSDATLTAPAGSSITITSASRRFLNVLVATGTQVGAGGVAATAASAEDVTVSVSNSKLVVTFPVAPPATALLPVGGITTPGGLSVTAPAAVYIVAPTTVMSAAAHMSERVGIRCNSVMYGVYSGIQTAANRTLITLETAGL